MGGWKWSLRIAGFLPEACFLMSTEGGDVDGAMDPESSDGRGESRACRVPAFKGSVEQKNLQKEAKV